jgi:hypothetical protein
MTCDDIRSYFFNNPDAGCDIDMKICSECLGVQFDIAFDTSTTSRDNIFSSECTDFYSQVTECLQKIIEMRRKKYFTYINDQPLSDASSYEKLKIRYDYLSNELEEIEKLNSMLNFINSQLSKMNKFLLWQVKKNDIPGQFK